VEEARESQIVQFSRCQADRLSNQERDRGRATTVACLPGESMIDFFVDLTDQDAFDVAA
jgi:hypothetical protein